MTIDLTNDDFDTQLNKLVEGAVKYQEQTPCTTKELVKHILSDILNNSWIDDELRENVVVSLSGLLEVNVSNPIYKY
jgi:hypothetical protein